MGGVASALRSLAKGAVAAIPKADAGELAAKTFKSLESGLRRTSAGNDVADLFKNDYLPAYHQAREQLFKSYMNVPKHLQPAPHEIDSQARNLVRNSVAGRNDYRLVGLVKAVANQPNISLLQIGAEQQSLADHIHMFLKDTKETKRGPQSVFKENLARKGQNQVKVDTGAKYHPPGPVERFATRAAQVVMLPAIAIPHIGTLFNYAFNTPTQDLAKGLANVTLHYGNVKQQMADFGVYAGTVSNAYAARYYGSRGIIATATGSDTFGTIVYQLTHEPGFNALREWTLSIGAATGKHVAERLAQEFVANPKGARIAGLQLKRMGLNLNEVIAKQGQLDPDMLRKAIYNFVDSKVFLDNTLNRSYFSGANGFMRLSTLYHGYVSRQGSMIKQALVDISPRNIIKGNVRPVQVAQTLATLGIVFPTVGLGLKSMQMWGRGQFDTTFTQDEKDLYGANGWTRAGEEWIDGMSHMAAFGVATDYLRAANRHQLAAAVMGPIGNEIANLAQDTVHLGKSFNPDDPNKSAESLERDLLEDTIPDNLGKLIAHRVLPTQAEQRAKSGRLKKLKSIHLKGLKKLN